MFTWVRTQFTQLCDLRQNGIDFFALLGLITPSCALLLRVKSGHLKSRHDEVASRLAVKTSQQIGY